VFRARVPTFAFERIKDAVYFHRLHGCGVDESEEEVRGNEMSRHVLRLWTALANGRIEGRALILLAKTPRGLGGWIKVAPDPDSPPVPGVSGTATVSTAKLLHDRNLRVPPGRPTPTAHEPAPIVWAIEF
jgi:hypothetical protein